MGTDIRRHTAPLGGETPRRKAFNDLSLSIADPVPVANVTERAQLITDLAAAGFGPSASHPVYVDRLDAVAGYTLERTVNGTDWAPVNRVSMDPTARDFMQGFSYTGTTSGAGGVNFTWPTPFSTICRSVVITPGDSAGGIGFVRLEGFTPTNSLTAIGFRCYGLTGAQLVSQTVRVNIIGIGQ